MSKPEAAVIEEAGARRSAVLVESRAGDPFIDAVRVALSGLAVSDVFRIPAQYERYRVQHIEEVLKW